MSGGLLVFSEDLTKYDFGSDHPMAPSRVTNTISLARQLGVLDRLRIVPPPNIDLALLETIHTSDYIWRRSDEASPTSAMGSEPATIQCFQECTRSRPG